MIMNGDFGKKVAILNQVTELNEDGSFNYGQQSLDKDYFVLQFYFIILFILNAFHNKTSFENADGIKVEAIGKQKKVGPKPKDIGTVSKGSYSYIALDGVVITVNWVADENGLQPTGEHLPTPPPMPEHVVKMLSDLKKKEKEANSYKSY